MGLDRDEVAGAHSKSAPDFVLLTRACQGKIDEEMNTKTAAVCLNLINTATCPGITRGDDRANKKASEVPAQEVSAVLFHLVTVLRLALQHPD